ncbi:MAG: autotransporter outer membrane beta-barrel domain-containing protein, partial [Acidimicrobiales bacterium]
GSRDLFAQLDNRGTMTVAHPLAINKATAQHQNTGLIGVTGGNLTLTQSGTGPSFTNGSGGVIDVGAGQILKVTGGTVLHQTGAVLQGRGTVDVAGSALTVAGQVRPGSSPGVLTVAGNYPVLTSAVTSIELGGLVAGAEYDRLTVTGTASVSGRLDVILIGAFAPRTGDVFLIVTAGSLGGAFAIGSLPPGAQVSYGTTGVEIRF